METMSALTIILFVVAITLTILVIVMGVQFVGGILALRKARKDSRRRNQAHRIK